MTDITQNLITEFLDYANAFSSGFLKPHKARDILFILGNASAIMNDEVRFLSFIKGSLGMEGFHEADIVQISDWLYNKLD